MTARLLATVAVLAAASSARAQGTEVPPPPPAAVAPAPAPAPAPPAIQPPPPVPPSSPPPAAPPPAALGSSASALAGPYLQARVGVYMNKSSDLEGINNGLHFEGAFGYRLHPNFAVEAGVGWYKGSTDPQTFNGVSVTASYSDLPITLSGKLILPAGVADAYLLAGVGLHNVKLEAEGSLGGNTSTVSASDTPIGYHFGGGITVPLTPQVSVGFELRYLLGNATFKIGNESTSGDIDALFVTGGLVVRL